MNKTAKKDGAGDKNILLQSQSWIPYFKLFGKVRIPWWLVAINMIGLTTISMNIMIKAYTAQSMITGGYDISIANIVTYTTMFIAFYAISYASNMLGQTINDLTTRNLQFKLWGKIIRGPMSYFGKQSPQELLTRTTVDVENAGMPLSRLGTLYAGVYASIAGYITLRQGYSAELANWATLILPIIILLYWVAARLSYIIHKRFTAINARVTGYLAERLGSVSLIKSVGAEDKEIAEGAAYFRRRFTIEFQNTLVEMGSSIICGIYPVVFMFILIIGYGLVEKGVIEDLGVVSQFYLISLSLILSNLGSAGTLFGMTVKSSLGAMSKVTEVMEVEEEVVQRKRSFYLPDDDIRFENVTFAYDEKTDVLKDVSFAIPHGKTTAIVGANGAGKSTIINLLSRLYTPDRGKIVYGQIDAEEIHLDEWRKAFSYVPQNSPLFSGTIRENICFGLEKDVGAKEIEKAAKLAGAYDFIMELPDKFDTEVGENGSLLSGGERQRVAIARALIKNPDYLLLDEATANLDAENEALVQQGFRNLMQGRTTVVIAHNMRTIADADQVVVMEDGKISGVGSYDELCRSNPIFKNYVALQTVKAN